VDAFSLEIVYQVGRVLEMGVATGVVTLTLTRAKMFLPARRWIIDRSSWWGELVSCPYCMAHWVAAFFTICSFATWGRPRAIQGVLVWLVTVGLGSVVAKSIFLAIITILPTQSEAPHAKAVERSKAA